MKMDCSLAGKVALITGAGRGIGKAIAIGMAQAGADIVLASRKMPDLEKAAQEIRSLGRKALPVSTHVGKLEEIRNLIEKAVAEFGTIDILVNNAAANPTMASAMDIDERAWDAIMNLNLKGLFFLSQAVARIMKEKGGGKIINVSSTDGISPENLPVYAMSKAAVNMATRVMAKEWARFNIRVNAIAPGFIEVAKSWKLHPTYEQTVRPARLARVPLGRMGVPGDVADLAVFLASDASSYITGQVIRLDGGAVTTVYYKTETSRAEWL